MRSRTLSTSSLHSMSNASLRASSSQRSFPALTRSSFSALSHAELQEECYVLGVSSVGTRRALLERLDDHAMGNDRAPVELRGRGHNW